MRGWKCCVLRNYRFRQKMENKELHSVHAFMLPLRWDYLPKGYSPVTGKDKFSFDERTNMQKMCDYLLKSGWERNFYRIEGQAENYNELTYFHAFAAKTLFDLQQPLEKNNTIIDDHKVMAYFCIEPEKGENAYYKIATSTDEFLLELTGISLHIYNSGVAILTYNLENYSYSNPEEILKINEFGRRIYPQFLTNNANATDAVKNVFHPCSIQVFSTKISNGYPVKEDFSHFDDISTLETHKNSGNGQYTYGTIVKIPAYVTCLFNDSFVFAAKEERQEKIRFNLLADDRMFFQCWYGNNDVAKKLKEKTSTAKQEEIYGYENSCFLYAFLNGDRSTDKLGIGNNAMLKKNIEDSVYTRWAEYGTIYGFTRDSFVAVTQSKEIMGALDISMHVKTMYYQMAVISLAQRAIILRFSAEVSSLADLGKTNRIQASDLIGKIYLNYIEFINKIYFREVTSHLQGIEIYSLFHKVMRIADDVKDLDHEIQELHNFSTMIKQDKQGVEAQWLSRIATIYLPASVIFSILGANFLPQDGLRFVNKHFDWISVFWIGVGLLPSLCYYIYFKFRKKK